MELSEQITAALKQHWPPILEAIEERNVPFDRFVSWTMMSTPMFPASYPCHEHCLLAAYGFAYGNQPTRLQDGSHVLGPWACVKVDAKNLKLKFEPLGRPERIGIQGVRPLRGEEIELFKSRPAAEALIQSLTPGGEFSASVIAYYRFWVATNGVIAKAVRSLHPEFFRWFEG